MYYSSKVRVESTKFPGVAFYILKITYARREILRELQAEALARVEAIQEKMAPLAKEYRAALEAAKLQAATAADPAAVRVEFPDEKFRELVQYGDQVNKIDAEELTPIAVRYALDGIEGVTIDGEPATLALIRERGPDLLYAEIAEAVQREIELTTEERENLLSPSTSAGAVDGEKTPGIANPAETPATITTAAALSSTDPASADAPSMSAAR